MPTHSIDRSRHPVLGLHRHADPRVRLVFGAVVLLLAAAVSYVAGFGAYGFVVGASEYLAQVPDVAPCHTPASMFGWRYEAINYDIADDARLLGHTPDPTDCGSQGEPAGGAVVSEDGTPIAGWYIPAAFGAPASGPTVIVVHGGKANKSGMLPYAVPLHRTYNLVLLDLRNSGRSGGRESTGGLRERADLRAMIDWLVATKQPSWIAVVGNSNGAATAVAEAVDDPRVRALVLDSMHAEIDAQLANVVESERGLPSWPAVPALIAGLSVRLGEDIASVDPVRLIGRLGDRPVLLTHGTADHVDRPEQSLDRNLAAATAAGVAVTVERCEGADHGMVVVTCGEAWGRWVVDFLAAARGG